MFYCMIVLSKRSGDITLFTATWVLSGQVCRGNPGSYRLSYIIHPGVRSFDRYVKWTPLHHTQHFLENKYRSQKREREIKDSLALYFLTMQNTFYLLNWGGGARRGDGGVCHFSILWYYLSRPLLIKVFLQDNTQIQILEDIDWLTKQE